MWLLESLKESWKLFGSDLEVMGSNQTMVKDFPCTCSWATSFPGLVVQGDFIARQYCFFLALSDILKHFNVSLSMSSTQPTHVVSSSYRHCHYGNSGGLMVCALDSRLRGLSALSQFCIVFLARQLILMALTSLSPFKMYPHLAILPPTVDY